MSDGPKDHVPDDDARPLVSVVIPVRNEEDDIADCLEAVARQDYPMSRIEILVVDGESGDQTAVRARSALESIPARRAMVLTNPDRTTPVALNRGLSHAEGAVLCRVDARSRIPENYLSTCVQTLVERRDVVVVGGSQRALAPTADPRRVGIARALNNRWAMGLSRYRSGRSSGPTDTVYLGVFRTEGVREAGGWDPFFSTNQDFDLNRRMARSGVVWFESDLRVGYIPRSAVSELLGQYRRFGRWKTTYWRRSGEGPQPRQWVLLLLPGAVGIAAAAWVLHRKGRLRRATILMASGLAGVATLERLGTVEPPSDWRGHLWAVAGIGAVGVGWLTGVAEGLLRTQEGGRPGR